MGKFTVNLVSNASMQIYPTNTMASFKTQLPVPIELDETWTAALSEISFPSIINNVTDGRISFCIAKKHAKQRVLETQIKLGAYTSVDAIMKEIERVTFGSDGKKQLTWAIDNETQILQVQLLEKSFITLRSKNLKNILGFTDDKPWVGPTTDKKPITANFPVDLQAGRHSMYVYCDLLGNEILGDKITQLLRVVPMSSLKQHRGPTTYLSVSNPQFKSIAKKYFHNVHIKLCDETGDIIPFLGVGRTNLTLLFKRLKL